MGVGMATSAEALPRLYVPSNKASRLAPACTAAIGASEAKASAGTSTECWLEAGLESRAWGNYCNDIIWYVRERRPASAGASGAFPAESAGWSAATAAASAAVASAETAASTAGASAAGASAAASPRFSHKHSPTHPGTEASAGGASVMGALAGLVVDLRCLWSHARQGHAREQDGAGIVRDT